MSDSGRGVGLTSSASRRVTRSASREAAASQTQPRSARQRVAQQPQPGRQTKSAATHDKEEDDVEVGDEERKDDDDADRAEDDDGTDTATPHLPEYDAVKSALLNEPPLSKAKRVYEYINRQHYNDIEREKQQRDAAIAADEAEQKQAAQPKFYNLLFTDPSNRSTLYTLLIVSLVMLLAPLSAFYATSYVLEAAGWQEKWVLSVSGAVAVVVVNVVSVGFGLYAYWEKEDVESEEEREVREGRTRAGQDEWVRSVTKGQMVGVGKWNEELKQEREEMQQGGRKKRR